MYPVDKFPLYQALAYSCALSDDKWAGDLGIEARHSHALCCVCSELVCYFSSITDFAWLITWCLPATEESWVKWNEWVDQGTCSGCLGWTGHSHETVSLPPSFPVQENIHHVTATILFTVQQAPDHNFWHNLVLAYLMNLKTILLFTLNNTVTLKHFLLWILVCQ